MDDFPSNSHKERGPDDAVKVKVVAQSEKGTEKKIERVVGGEVVRRKKPLGKRLRETFVGGDAKSVWGYVVLDVMIPAAKDMVADATSQGIEKMLFGEARSTSRRGRNYSGSNGHVSYNRMSSGSRPPWDRDRPDPRRSVSQRSRASHDFDEIILETRGEAEEVIDRLFELISKYETASVADLYELTGINGNYTDNKWGWSDIRGAGVTRVRSGYLLDLPRPEPLD